MWYIAYTWKHECHFHVISMENKDLIKKLKCQSYSSICPSWNNPIVLSLHQTSGYRLWCSEYGINAGGIIAMETRPVLYGPIQTDFFDDLIFVFEMNVLAADLISLKPHLSIPSASIVPQCPTPSDITLTLSSASSHLSQEHSLF